MSLSSFGEIDRLVHEPARLVILAYLAAVDRADFVFLMNEMNLTKGNLSSHMSKLEEAGLVEIEKRFVGKIPQTVFSLTPAGKEAFDKYKQKISDIIGPL